MAHFVHVISKCMNSNRAHKNTISLFVHETMNYMGMGVFRDILLKFNLFPKEFLERRLKKLLRYVIKRVWPNFMLLCFSSLLKGKGHPD